MPADSSAGVLSREHLSSSDHASLTWRGAEYLGQGSKWGKAVSPGQGAAEKEAGDVRVASSREPVSALQAWLEEGASLIL